MSILDFNLRYLQQQAAPTEEHIHVLLQFRNHVPTFEEWEFKVTSSAGDVAAGFAPVSRLEELRKHPNVVVVEGARRLRNELDISVVAINLIDPSTNLPTVPGRGRGAIVGVIDSSFDLTHPCFTDAEGKTRILAVWDQKNLDNVAGTPPGGFDYGVEYTRGMINQYLAEQRIVVVRNDPRRRSHGTSVAGIAAGNGAPDFVFKGVAPEAELILVVYRNDVAIGGSAFVLDAIRYMLSYARPEHKPPPSNQQHKPLVINLSQGDNLGAHDGTSLLERAIDTITEQENVLIVNSAGNSRGGKHHAEGRVESGEDYALPFELNLEGTNVVDGDAFDLWYRGEDRFALALRDPDGRQSRFVQPGSAEIITLPNGNQAYLCSDTNYPTNGDNRIGIILEKGDGWQKGSWALILRATELRHGDFHVWADRSDAPTIITFPGASDAITVTLPGTARRIITVSGSISRPEANIPGGETEGSIQPSTSLGPTRDGRIKPDLTAPGFTVIAPGNHRLDGDNPGNYNRQIGTSMSAPHVSGIIAVVWALKPGLTAEQIRSALCATARADHLTGATPNTTWGFGKLNAGAFFQALSGEPRETETNMSETERSDEELYEFQLNVPNMDDTGSIPLTVQIRVKGGNIDSIKGFNEGGEYEGMLRLKRLTKAPPGAEGGDECIVCQPRLGCREVIPCPEDS